MLRSTTCIPFMAAGHKRPGIDSRKAVINLEIVEWDSYMKTLAWVLLMMNIRNEHMWTREVMSTQPSPQLHSGGRAR